MKNQKLKNGKILNRNELKATVGAGSSFPRWCCEYETIKNVKVCVVWSTWERQCP
ncbi:MULTISPECIES: hypothetical protein [unclassified Chryseobacterium]|uniref:hypothetical protein n=1 Tax=unclassified Chryseobacterium TaxID=2593645 RepID=UPI0013FD9D6F|nr:MULTISPECIES: hypothetical protein [unclassified Chryseobacterium]